MALNREDLIKTLVRKELDRYVMGYSLKDRMAGLLDEVEEWTGRWIAEARAEGRPILTSTIYSDLYKDSREDILAHLMEIDTNNVVKGAALAARVRDLQSIAFGWAYDRRVMEKTAA